MTDSPKETLQDFIRRAIADKGLNYRVVAANSGGLITHSTAYDVIKGRSLNPTVTTLRGLAKGIGVSEDKIFAVARGIQNRDTSVADELVMIARQLPIHRQQDLIKLAQLFLSESIPADARTSEHVNLPESERTKNGNVKMTDRKLTVIRKRGKVNEEVSAPATRKVK